jgi:hypothetical protein
MALPQIYEDQFREILAKRTYNPRTMKAYRSMFRRMCRDLNEEDLTEPAVLIWYRWHMAGGSMAIFSAIWGILRGTEVGRRLAVSPEKPRIMYPHPLYADIMHLGAIYGNERLPEMTWAECEGHFLFDEKVVEARRRVFEWFMGTDATPTEKTPLVVCNRLGNPMQLWQVETIINSPTANKDHKRRYTREGLGAFLTDVIALLVSRGIDAALLRSACDRIAKIGTHAAEFQFDVAYDDLAACSDVPSMLGIVALFPIDQDDTTPPLW